MLYPHSKTHFKGLLSASAIALTLSIAPAYGQTGSADTGYSARASTPTTTTTTSGNTRTVVDRNTTNTARTQAQAGVQNRADTRTQNRTTYGTGTTASARGGEIITRSGSTTAQSGNSVTVEQTLRHPQNTSRYQTQGNVRGRTAAGNTAQARTGTPTAPQTDNRYSPDRLSEITPSVGTTTTTIERTSREAKNDMYRDIENDSRRIDQQLKSTLSTSERNENATLGTRNRIRTNR